MGTVEVDGLRVGYERAGQGPPVVLLHGYVGDGAATWRGQLEGSATGSRWWPGTCRGPGGRRTRRSRSGWRGTPTPAGFIGRLGLERPHVVGLSLGGALALELYRRHPGVPATLVLASAYAGWGGSLPAEVGAQRLRQALALSELSGEEFVGTLLPTMFSEGTAPEAVAAFRASMLGFHPAGFRAMARASAGNVRDVLGRIEVPTLLVYGDNDVRAPLAVGEDLHAAIPGSRLVVLPDVGHVCNVEAPDEFNRVVRDFLSISRSR